MKGLVKENERVSQKLNEFAYLNDHFVAVFRLLMDHIANF